MYWEERKLHWEAKMTYILGKLEIANVAYRENILCSQPICAHVLL
jgi:hypothetical protein